MAKLTIKDLNCGNCPNCTPSTVRPGFMKCAVSNYILNGSATVEEHIKITGCASHPLALQVLAGPVIEELERRAKQAEAIGGKGHEILAYEEAIKLLKEGVKEP